MPAPKKKPPTSQPGAAPPAARTGTRSPINNRPAAGGPTDMRLAEAARRLREGADMTQEQVAVRLGVHKGTISKWERSDRVWTAQAILDYSSAIGMSPHHLLRMAGIIDPPWTIEELVRTDPTILDGWRPIVLAAVDDGRAAKARQAAEQATLEQPRHVDA